MHLGRHSTPLPLCPEPPDPQLPTPGMLEAMAARGQATEGLLHAIGRGPEVRETVRQVAAHGRRNHFIELLGPTLPHGGSQR